MYFMASSTLKGGGVHSVSQCTGAGGCTWCGMKERESYTSRFVSCFILFNIHANAYGLNLPLVACVHAFKLTYLYAWYMYIYIHIYIGLYSQWIFHSIILFLCRLLLLLLLLLGFSLRFHPRAVIVDGGANMCENQCVDVEKLLGHLPGVIWCSIYFSFSAFTTHLLISIIFCLE